LIAALDRFALLVRREFRLARSLMRRRSNFAATPSMAKTNSAKFFPRPAAEHESGLIGRNNETW
jgi:hypothetical protein